MGEPTIWLLYVIIEYDSDLLWFTMINHNYPIDYRAILSHRIHGAIFGNMDPIYPSHVSIYTSTMDPSWDIIIY